MIHDLGISIKNILLDNMPSNVEVKFDQPVKGWIKSGEPLLNLYLFDVRENNVLRAHHWQPAADPAVQDNGTNGKKRTPFRFDCHYLLTAWAKEIIDQQRILSEAIVVLLQYPILPKAFLVGSLQVNESKHQMDIPARVGGHDKLTNPAELWSALDNQIRPAISYVVTIPFDPWQVEREEPPVFTKHLILEQWQKPQTAVSHTEIAGEIKSKNSLPPNLHVTLSNDKWQYRADVEQNGRYRINAIIPDSYTLTVWVQANQQTAKKLGEQPVVVPPPIQILALADSFQLQIGTQIEQENLHLTPRRPGFVGKAKLNGFQVKDIGSQMPRSGIYHFGRDEDGITAVIPTTTKPENSFKLIYTTPQKNVGRYDLSI